MLCVFGCPYLTKPKNRLPTSNHHLTTSSQYAVLAHLIVHSLAPPSEIEKKKNKKTRKREKGKS